MNTWQSEVRGWLITAAAVFCLGSIGYRVITAPKIPDLAPTVVKVNAEIDEAHRLTLEAGLTAMEARKASAKEISQLDIWNKQFSQSVSVFQGVMVQTRDTLAAVQGTSEAATGAVQTTQETVAALQAPITQAAATLQAAQKAMEALQPVIAHVDTLVTSPEVKATVTNLASTSAHVDGITGDFQHALHPILNPDPCKTKGCRVKRAFAKVIGAASAGEGIYYSGQVLKEIF